MEEKYELRRGSSMCYSLDLRKKVISCIENGNRITRAARIAS